MQTSGVPSLRAESAPPRATFAGHSNTIERHGLVAVRPSLRDRVNGSLLVQHQFLDNARQHVRHWHEVFQENPVFASARCAVQKTAQTQAGLCFHPMREGGPETGIGTELRAEQRIFHKSLRDFSRIS